ncbi:MAG: ferredoxin [Candidatus Omnitrophica bacterium]|nr:ferredoxin [Candidatus Omnitrophota bacterium]
MKVLVDKDACIGCGFCTQVCPQVFKMEDDKAIVYVSIIPHEAEDCCKEAVEDCPVKAIMVE